MPFEIIRNDITKMQVDAIVNAANSKLQGGGGVCGAIFKAAGKEELQRACDAIGNCDTGKAVITSGFDLVSKYIIHTVGPIYCDGTKNEAELLHDCYKNSLKLAMENNCESIAFPLISSGIYKFPKGEAFKIATKAINDFLVSNEIMVYLVVFDQESFAISKTLLENVSTYIDDNYKSRTVVRKFTSYGRIEVDSLEVDIQYDECITNCKSKAINLDDIIKDLDESFSETLLKIINSKNKTDAEIYKKANIDRKLFSKIRGNTNYSPSKKTVIALAIALELTIIEACDLLKRAGFSLSHSNKFDVIIEYFLKNKKYNIFEINEVLFYYDQPLLGGVS